MSRRAQEKWSHHITAWEQSGLSMAAYARQHGLSPVTLSSWKRRLRLAPRPEVAFVEVGMASAARPALEVELGAYRVRVPAELPAETLRGVFVALGMRS
jgi:transposase-like protein